MCRVPGFRVKGVGFQSLWVGDCRARVSGRLIRSTYRCPSAKGPGLGYYVFFILHPILILGSIFYFYKSFYSDD